MLEQRLTRTGATVTLLLFGMGSDAISGDGVVGRRFALLISNADWAAVG